MPVSITISFRLFLNNSCSVVIFGSPVSARSRFARFSKSAGANVSGKVAHRHETTPAKIMLICEIPGGSAEVPENSENGAYPEDPPPANGLANESADNRSEDGAAKRRHRFVSTETR